MASKRAGDSGPDSPAKRTKTAAPVVNPRRVRQLSELPMRPGPIVHWMSREQRADENWTLLKAVELAENQGTFVVVVFSLVHEFLGAGYRQFAFMLRGLEEVSARLDALGIPFVLLRGDPGTTVSKFAEAVGAGAVVTDFTPMRTGRQWVSRIAGSVKCPVLEVDSRNIVPCWVASNKIEYGARTIRPKIHSHLAEFLEPFPELCKPATPSSLSPEELGLLASQCSDPVPDGPEPVTEASASASASAAASEFGLAGHSSRLNWASILDHLTVDRSVKEVAWIKPGPAAANAMLASFLRRVKAYKDRNDPSKDATSVLSPYLHFGHISSQAAALAARAIRGSAPEQVDSFIEEMVVRRELCDNYVFYNQSGYDRLSGLYPQYGNASWAQKTLADHAEDKRGVVYSRGELERGETHDPLWNGMQAEMVHRGHMPGFNRMYWAKKILEWTSSPEEALEIAIYLNDKYELDGRDPNGYVGCAWAIAGLHDQGWAERPVFGKIRYMNLAGCLRKFDPSAYITRVARIVEAETSIKSSLASGNPPKLSKIGHRGQLWGLAGKR